MPKDIETNEVIQRLVPVSHLALTAATMTAVICSFIWTIKVDVARMEVRQDGFEKQLDGHIKETEEAKKISIVHPVSTSSGLELTLNSL
jgi:hypothetical protein